MEENDEDQDLEDAFFRMPGTGGTADRDQENVMMIGHVNDDPLLDDRAISLPLWGDMTAGDGTNAADNLANNGAAGPSGVGPIPGLEGLEHCGGSALSTVPNTLVRWTEESRVLDGDSQHDCMTVCKPGLLDVIEKHREEEDLANAISMIEKEELMNCKLKANSAKKRGELDESKLFQEFRTEVGEMNDFVAEKRKLVREDSFRDGIGNIKAKAKKHQVLEGEIKANAGQLKVLNRTGQQMVQRNHFKAREIGLELEGVNSAWVNLVEAVKEQGSKLRQAEAQNDYNRMTADIKTKMADIKSLMNSTDTGEDMRGCKKLLSQHTAAEAELAAVEHKVAGLGNVAADLADGHFDGDAILTNCDDLKQAVELLRTHCKNRKEALKQSMKFHEFNFDLQRELEWIAEKATIISAPVEIQSLQQAQSFCRKHKKLEEEVNNHSAVVDKVVESGKMLSGPNFADEVISNMSNLTNAWNNLLAAIETKGSQLKLMLTAQQDEDSSIKKCLECPVCLDVSNPPLQVNTCR